ncbi:glycosyltransferase [Roseiarcaceae bacterium H3SJ34-1]|uniref:glycosyltransferase n=1 Tax=Terripilifer ovatus TaxID=3032367 RepID=UPI003AB98000|nr:glycosyltransferase [Roseiarcaceae bacterium H3SJ34-1]
MYRRLAIIMPVFNDWESMESLLEAIDTTLVGFDLTIDVIAVDDCSTMPCPQIKPPRKSISSVTIVRLGANVGHQRAIATGLVKVAQESEADLVAVMDSDGEDTPQELKRLLQDALASPGYGIVAQRKRRSEGLVFKFFYMIYTRVFRILTGHKINFGNFVVLPISHVKKLVYSPNIWNNFPSSIVFSKLPMKYLDTVRGTRYFGQSKMNFVNLVAHGLGAVSVFSEAVFIRILVASIVLFLGSFASAILAIAIRIFTATAIPGWTTNALGFALLVSIQAVLVPIMMAFLLLNNRSSLQISPKEHAPKLIVETWTVRRSVEEAPLSGVAGTSDRLMD